MQLTFRRVDWTFKAVFRIAYRTQAIAETLQVELQDGQWRGRGEGLPIAYRQETAESMAEVLKEVDAELKRGVDIASVLSRLSPGGARNALDCALWDLHAKR